MVIICVRNCVLRINAANVGNVGYNLHSRTARRSHWQNDDGKSEMLALFLSVYTLLGYRVEKYVFNVFYKISKKR